MGKDTRQIGNDESSRRWLERRVGEILTGEGVQFNFGTFGGGTTITFAPGDKPLGTTKLISGGFTVSLGKEEDLGKLFPDQLRQVYGSAMLTAQGLGVTEVNIKGATPWGLMGIQSALLRADELKTKVSSRGVTVVNIDQEDGAEHLAVARACNVSRWLTALPPNVLRMDPFYNLLRDTFLGKPGVTLLGDNRNGEPTQEEYTRMGLLNAVAQGNGGYRRVFAIRIDPESGPTEEVNAYVGKTLIFDAGGYNNKGTHARGMKGDMGGGARVYGAARYFMDNRHLLKRSVVFVWTITKNMIGPDGYTPDDVVTAFSDKTVEIDNTDAEGRLALSDAIAWICTKVKIQRVIAVCTLTGAVGVALGVSATGMHLKNSRRRLNEVGRLEDLSFQCGDPVNVLHHFGEGARLLRSSIADIKNSSGGKRDAGSQQGFAFLLAHTPEEVDLMELDIAGSSGDFSDSDGIQPGTSRPAGTAFLIAMETSDLANAA